MIGGILFLGVLAAVAWLVLKVIDQLDHKHGGPGYVEPWDL